MYMGIRGWTVIPCAQDRQVPNCAAPCNDGNRGWRTRHPHHFWSQIQRKEAKPELGGAGRSRICPMAGLCPRYEEQPVPLVFVCTHVRNKPSGFRHTWNSAPAPCQSSEMMHLLWNEAKRIVQRGVFQYALNSQNIYSVGNEILTHFGQ